jgi:hypothetical protein
VRGWLRLDGVLRQSAIGQTPVDACFVHGELGFDGVLQIHAGDLGETEQEDRGIR